MNKCHHLLYLSLSVVLSSHIISPSSPILPPQLESLMPPKRNKPATRRGGGAPAAKSTKRAAAVKSPPSGAKPRHTPKNIPRGREVTRVTTLQTSSRLLPLRRKILTILRQPLLQRRMNHPSPHKTNHLHPIRHHLQQNDPCRCFKISIIKPNPLELVLFQHPRRQRIMKLSIRSRR